MPRLTVRELVDEFLVEKRKLKGRCTADTYRSRLRPVLDFAEQPTVLKRWPLAAHLDRDFVVELRAFLHQYVVTRNGRAGGKPRPMSAVQVVNVLECLRTLLSWARRAEVRKLPVTWVNPVSPDLVGSRPAKDPLREDKLPLAERIRLVATMDRWQLCHLALSVVLPLRPDEAAKPTASNGLGMTGHYTHTRPETQRQQIEQALRRWPKSLDLGRPFAQGGSPC